jgi:hypothetical protein
MNTTDGIRALNKEKPVDPESVEKYLDEKFGGALPSVRAAMITLAKALKPETLADEAFRLYEAFRPGVPGGVGGWARKESWI